MTMKLISTVNSVSNSGLLDFQNIPQNFTDLMLVVSMRNTAAGGETYITVNGIGGNGTLTTMRFLRGVGNSASSYTLNSVAALFQVNYQSSSDTANTFGSLQMYVPNYASTTVGKTYSIESVHENNATAAYQILAAGYINQTNAVTSLQVGAGASGNWVAGTTASLYGITKGSGGATVA